LRHVALIDPLGQHPRTDLSRTGREPDLRGALEAQIHTLSFSSTMRPSAPFTLLTNASSLPAVPALTGMRMT
jgi:hypothetical protein